MSIKYQDVTTLLLTNVQKNKTILPIVIDTIFYRNQKGHFTDDLVWAFFEARYPYSLLLIANYLSSNNLKDAKLACKLLNFVPSINLSIDKDDKKQYIDIFYWLKENYPFLYFTGESFQRTSKPKPYIVILDFKYLCKRVSVNTGKPLIQLTQREKNQLALFNNLSEYNKLLLSTFSTRIHYKNIYLRQSWINNSINKQIIIAKATLGG